MKKLVFLFVLSAFIVSCVPNSKYDKLESEYDEMLSSYKKLEERVNFLEMQVAHLYTQDSELEDMINSSVSKHELPLLNGLIDDGIIPSPY